MLSSTPATLETLLQQHDNIRLQINKRLENVTLELQRLDALRQCLTLPKYDGVPIRRSVQFPVTDASAAASPSSSAFTLPKRKRGREDDSVGGHAGSDDSGVSSEVAYLTVHGVEREVTAVRRTDPFEDASLYAEVGNPIAQFGVLQRSHDEEVRQQLLSLFPLSRAWSVRKAKQLSSLAISRIQASMFRANVPAKCVSIGQQDGQEAYLRVNCFSTIAHTGSADTPAEDHSDLLRLLSTVENSKSVQEIRTAFCSDPTTVGAYVYAGLAGLATAPDTLPSLERTPVAVKLLGLRAFTKTTGETVGGTFAQCCRCVDRDVAESNLVQWVQTLRSVRPRRCTTSALQETVLFAAVCYTLLQKLKAAAAVRRGYLIYVLMACCGYARAMNLQALTSGCNAAALFEHISTVFEEDSQLLP